MEGQDRTTYRAPRARRRAIQLVGGEENVSEGDNGPAERSPIVPRRPVPFFALRPPNTERRDTVLAMAQVLGAGAPILPLCTNLRELNVVTKRNY